MDLDVVGWTKLLLAGGETLETTGSTVPSKVLDLNAHTNNCDDLPKAPPFYGATGAVLDNGSGVLICGGQNVTAIPDNPPLTTDSGTCQDLLTGDTLSMSVERVMAASIVLNSGSMLWITGGYNQASGGPSNPLDSSEFVTLSGGSITGPTLPSGMESHCMAKYNDSAVIVMSGGPVPSLTPSIYLLDSGSWINGPVLTKSQSGSVCGHITDTVDGTERVVIVGSKEDEIFQHFVVPTGSDPMPATFELDSAQMAFRQATSVVSGDGTALIVLAGTFYDYDYSYYPSFYQGDLKRLFKLTFASGSHTWQNMLQLITPDRRKHAVAMLIPDSLTTCDF